MVQHLGVKHLVDLVLKINTNVLDMPLETRICVLDTIAKKQFIKNCSGSWRLVILIVFLVEINLSIASKAHLVAVIVVAAVAAAAAAAAATRILSAVVPVLIIINRRSKEKDDDNNSGNDINIIK